MSTRWLPPEQAIAERWGALAIGVPLTECSQLPPLPALTCTGYILQTWPGSVWGAELGYRHDRCVGSAQLGWGIALWQGAIESILGGFVPLTSSLSHGQTIQITNTGNQRVHSATIVDLCPGCASGCLGEPPTLLGPPHRFLSLPLPI